MWGGNGTHAQTMQSAMPCPPPYDAHTQMHTHTRTCACANARTHAHTNKKKREEVSTGASSPLFRVVLVTCHTCAPRHTLIWTGGTLHGRTTVSVTGFRASVTRRRYCSLTCVCTVTVTVAELLILMDSACIATSSVVERCSAYGEHADLKVSDHSTNHARRSPLVWHHKPRIARSPGY